jgi:hypothetical protein
LVSTTRRDGSSQSACREDAQSIDLHQIHNTDHRCIDWRFGLTDGCHRRKSFLNHKHPIANASGNRVERDNGFAAIMPFKVERLYQKNDLAVVGTMLCVATTLSITLAMIMAGADRQWRRSWFQSERVQGEMETTLPCLGTHRRFHRARADRIDGYSNRPIRQPFHQRNVLPSSNSSWWLQTRLPTTLPRYIF